jgi:HD superfamily phosphohydrolase
MIKYDIFVRDPLYGFIGLTGDEVKLIDTEVVQRLRRIKQLANAYRVYPGACHTRFEHSLGVMHIATRMAEQLELSREEIEIIRYASLLHDIGHGPFSHAFESVLSSANEPEKISHEDITYKIIKTDEKIREILGDKIDDVLSLFSTATVSREIISGNIDADRLDYLRRDSYYTGVAYGEFDIERILHTIHKKTDGDRSFLTVLEKGMDAIESFRLARFLMHTQVYNHHTRLICDSMLQRSVEIAFRDGVIESDKFKLNNPKFLDNYLQMDDFRLINQLLSDVKSNSHKLASDLENRCLLKRGYELDVTQHPDAMLKLKITRLTIKNIKILETKLANICGCSSDYIIVYKNTIKNSLFGARIEDNKSPILIETKNDKIQEIETVSSLFNSWRPPTKFFVFCPEEYRPIIQQHTEEIIRSIPM